MKTMMTILDRIFEHKRDEIARAQRVRPLAVVRGEAEGRPPIRDFLAALDRRTRENSASGWPALIAEVKRASPSRGDLAPDIKPTELAKIYRDHGAAAISVLTDQRFFKGALADLIEIADQLEGIPILRKDFICDPYQIYESRAAGADAVLLIVSMLDPGRLVQLYALVRELGMIALLEIHSEAELEIALQCSPRLIGINSRDLRDFSVSLETALQLRPLVPPGIGVIAESGIHTASDVVRLAQWSFDGILVGEALVTAPDIPRRVRELAGAKAANGPVRSDALQDQQPD